MQIEKIPVDQFLPPIPCQLMDDYQWQLTLSSAQPIDDGINTLNIAGHSTASLVIFCGKDWADKYAKNDYYHNMVRVWVIDVNTLILMPRIDTFGYPTKVFTGNKIYYSIWMN